MNNVTALHRRAMDFMDAATASRRTGDSSGAYQQLRSAVNLETEAANLLRFVPSAEPSRSILYRSAASLALQCEMYSEAENLIYRALAGDPSEELREDLQILLENTSFKRHLAVKGVALSNRDVQVVIEGKGIGYGVAPTSEVLPRVEGTNLLLYRTAERLGERAYREAGRPTDEIKDLAESFIGLPRAASYAFSLTIGRSRQMYFDDPSENLLNELLDCLEFVERGDENSLRRRIVEPAYYNNFIALAQNILPDGVLVKTVGFTVQRAEGTREVSLRKTAHSVREQFSPVLTPTTKRIARGMERPVEVSGQLRLADSVHENNRIQVVPEHGRAVTIYVPEGMMTDIVKPLWDTWVTVDGLKMGRSITLMSIRKMT